jgi:4-hydroxythreonine-4-phosphate dehydrogenase
LAKQTIREAPGKPLALTAGEPAGIGPDLCVHLAGTARAADVVVITDPRLLEARARLLGKTIEMDVVDPDADAIRPATPPGALRVLAQAMPNPRACGVPDPANARVLLDGLRLAVEGCTTGHYSGIVTAPLQKSVINDAGIPFTGHTEYLAELTGTPLPVMLLVGGGLRIALASTHMPLRAVPDYITSERLRAVLEILHGDLARKFAIADPEIVVCGLNPHAGEGGHLGREDDDIIRPVVEDLRAGGWNIRGPLPADTAFTPAGGHADAYLAMYHDQGLPVLKHAAFGAAVNVTLGLPIVRTSVDHGTALDIAGRGGADPGSLIAAVELARELTRP